MNPMRCMGFNLKMAARRDFHPFRETRNPVKPWYEVRIPVEVEERKLSLISRTSKKILTPVTPAKPRIGDRGQPRIGVRGRHRGLYPFEKTGFRLLSASGGFA